MKRYMNSNFLLVAAMISFGFNSVASASDRDWEGTANWPDNYNYTYIYNYNYNHNYNYNYNHDCPAGLLDGSTTLDMEFGPGTENRTDCIRNRTNVKVMVQINQFCRDAWNSAGERVLEITDCDPGRAYALHNIDNMLKDFEITQGMRPGEDFDVVAVVHGEGNTLLLQDGYTFDDTVKGEVTVANPYQADVEALIAKGVRFFFCQNATRYQMSHGMLPSNMEGEGSAVDVLIPGVEFITAGMTAMADFQSRGYRLIQP